VGDPHPPVPVAIALGSNLGDRVAHLNFAVERLAAVLSDLKVSRFHETDPVGVEPQGRFLNAAATGGTTLDAAALLDELLEIERQRGRTRPRVGAPRTLDLDLILYGSVVLKTTKVHVPHPRFRERAFVLEPLAEIAGDWKDPETGLTVSRLLESLASA